MEFEEVKKIVEIVSKTLPKDRYALSEWREEVCLSIKDLCDMVGISPGYFRTVRSGKNPISKKIYSGIYQLSGGKVSTKTDIIS